MGSSAFQPRHQYPYSPNPATANEDQVSKWMSWQTPLFNTRSRLEKKRGNDRFSMNPVVHTAYSGVF